MEGDKGAFCPLEMKHKITWVIVVIILVLLLVLPGCIIIRTGGPGPSASPALYTPEGSSTKLPEPSPSVSTSPSASPTPASPAPLTVNQRRVSEDNRYIKIDVVYPQISGMQDTGLQGVVNDAAKGEMEKLIKDMQDESEKYYHDCLADGSTFCKYSLTAELDVHANDGTLLSLAIRMGEFCGGASSSDDSVFINVLNTKPGRTLTLGSIFTDSAKGFQRVNAQIADAIARDTQGYYFSDSPAAASDQTGFYLTPADLVVVFKQYDIAAGAAGEPEFHIPLSSLADILIPGIPH